MKDLFDFKFEHFITKTVIKVLYAVFVAISALVCAVGFYSNFKDSFWLSLAFVFGFYIVSLLLRVLFEDRVVKFEMAEDIKEIRKKLSTVRETSAVRETSSEQTTSPTPKILSVNGYEIKPYAILIGANLVGLDLQNVNLLSANLSDANLEGAKLQGADLRSANLSGANLTGANLTGANLRGANLQGANLQGANLRGANREDANLTGAKLSGTIMPDGTILN